MTTYRAVVLAAVALSGCTTEKIQYLTRPPFNPPPDATAGFLGYFTVSTQQTTCGNCHVDHQQRWKGTKHAVAWATLQGTGHAQSFCNSCHTVSANGNLATAPAGYDKVADSVYQDVQCENCHGPGLTHVTTPDNPQTVPLAPIGADTSATPKFGCAGCHTGTHEPFIQEWKASKHSQLITFAAAQSPCMSCHEGRGALAAWGVTAKYVEQNNVCNGTTGAGCTPTTCAVCHDPHGSPNDKQLRFPVNVADENTNLCMKCHSRRAQVVATSTRGPHAPQGPVLLGTAGWWPPGYTPDTSPTSHGTTAANPNLCAGCHVYRFQVTDTLTKAFKLQVAGHLFLPIPCLDASGAPLTDATANTCPFPGDAGFVVGTTRSLKACAQSGCHATETLAANAFVSRRQAIKALALRLWADLDGDGVLDAAPKDTGYLPKIMAARPGEFTGSTLTAAKGALFNAQLFGEGLAANGDRSFGVHNPFLADSLLRASTSYLVQIYGGIVPGIP